MAGKQNKSTRLNLRITPEFRQQLQELADAEGFELSPYALSLLINGVRAKLEGIAGVANGSRGRKKLGAVLHVQPASAGAKKERRRAVR